MKGNNRLQATIQIASTSIHFSHFLPDKTHNPRPFIKDETSSMCTASKGKELDLRKDLTPAKKVDTFK